MRRSGSSVVPKKTSCKCETTRVCVCAFLFVCLGEPFFSSTHTHAVFQKVSGSWSFIILSCLLFTVTLRIAWQHECEEGREALCLCVCLCVCVCVCVSTAWGFERVQPAALMFSGNVKSDLLQERHVKIKTQWPPLLSAPLPFITHLFSSHPPICPSPLSLPHLLWAPSCCPFPPTYSSPPLSASYLTSDHLFSLSIFTPLIYIFFLPPSSLSLLLLCDTSCIIKGDHCSSWGQHQSAVSDSLHHECVRALI